MRFFFIFDCKGNYFIPIYNHKTQTLLYGEFWEKENPTTSHLDVVGVCDKYNLLFSIVK